MKPKSPKEGKGPKMRPAMGPKSIRARQATKNATKNETKIIKGGKKEAKMKPTIVSKQPKRRKRDQTWHQK